MSYANSYTRRHVRSAPNWTVLFGLWIALILPLLAFGVSYSKAGESVVRVSGAFVTNPPTNADNPVPVAPARDAYTLQRQAILHPDKETRVQATVAMSRLRQNWANALGIEIRAWNAAATSPRNAEKVVIAVRRDLFISRDGGQTFEHKQNVLPSMVNSLAIQPTNDNVLFAGVDGLGFYTSVDGGSTWQPMNTGIQVTPGARFGITAIEIDADAPQTMYIAAGIWLGTGHVTFHPLGILKTTNGGATWTQLETQVGETIDAMLLDGKTLHTWSDGLQSSYGMQ